MSVRPESKFFEVDGVRVAQPEIRGAATWLNLFAHLQQQHPNKQVKCGWIYNDGSESVMMQTPAKRVNNPEPCEPSRRKRYHHVEEPGDTGSTYDDYLEWKHYERGDL